MLTASDVEVSENSASTRSLKRILRAFNSASDNIEASAVVSSDGLPLAWVLDENADPDRFGAMCASLLALANRAARETSRGNLKQVLIEGDNGTMLLVHAGPKAVLVTAAKPTVNLGKIFIDARKIAKQVAAVKY